MARTSKPPEAPSKRWMTDEETTQIVKAAALTLLETKAPMTTSQLLNVLEIQGGQPPAVTRSGQLRQLEKALESEEASRAGISVEPGKFRNGKGRAATRRWHVDPGQARARLIAA